MRAYAADQVVEVGPVVRTEPALTDWHTLAEIRAALHAGQITGGMTLELSLAHPELVETL